MSSKTPNAMSTADWCQISRQLQLQNSSFFLVTSEQIALLKVAINPALKANDLNSPRRHLNKSTEVQVSPVLREILKSARAADTNSKAVDKPQLSCPPSAVIVQCDRALERKACGTAVAHYKKFATTVSHKFFRPRACFRTKTAAHCAVAVLGGQRAGAGLAGNKAAGRVTAQATKRHTTSGSSSIASICSSSICTCPFQ